MIPKCSTGCNIVNWCEPRTESLCGSDAGGNAPAGPHACPSRRPRRVARHRAPVRPRGVARGPRLADRCSPFRSHPRRWARGERTAAATTSRCASSAYAAHAIQMTCWPEPVSAQGNLGLSCSLPVSQIQPLPRSGLAQVHMQDTLDCGLKVRVRPAVQRFNDLLICMLGPPQGQPSNAITPNTGRQLKPLQRCSLCTAIDHQW